MEAKIEILSAHANQDFERDFMGEGEIVVRREGHSNARHIFTVDGRIIGRLRWQGMRRAVYETETERFDIKVGPLDKRIAIISSEGSESFLVERARANPNKAGLRVEMAEGDNFRLLRSYRSRLRSEISMSVNKQFYATTLMSFSFDTRRRTQTTVRIRVEPVMRREARFIHRLLALVVCRIILERRHSGLQPVRMKEKPGHPATKARAPSRKRVI